MRRAHCIQLLIILTALLLDRPVASGQQPAAQTGGSAQPTSGMVAARCSGPEYRAFDFWIGRWTVRNDAGQVLGENEITRIGQGCGLLEEWRGATGGVGTSVNAYDAARNVWTQRWVGNGATLWLEGGVQENRMVLRGTAPRATPRGPVTDRITWTRLPDGRVTQEWDISTDDGRTWQKSFKGTYERLQ